MWKVLLSILVGLFLLLYYQWNILRYYSVYQQPMTTVQDSGTPPSNMANDQDPFQNQDPSDCSFRNYPLHRYYNVSLPDTHLLPFLWQAKYIRGHIPFVINPPNVRKLCVTTSHWESIEPPRRAFSDGQNPSIVSLKPDMRLDPRTLEPFARVYGDRLADMYIASLLFGDSQCRWNMTQKDLQTYQFSSLTEPPSKRTLILLLDSQLKLMNRVTLTLERDADWGTTKRKIAPGPTRSIVEFDDLRFFFYNRTIHVLYRNGPVFGYDRQVQNPLHFERDDTGGEVRAYVKASETFLICCGRNIAFLPQTSSLSPSLLAMTWVDPLTIVDVTDNIYTHNDTIKPTARRIMSTPHSSGIHGTNGYLLPYGENEQELLGIAHFHRPEGRDSSEYARHGHHYTHAFFTIGYKYESKEYQLMRLSNEFVFASQCKMQDTVETRDIGDVIQFGSGLDISYDGRIVMSYGINDCEGGVFFLEQTQLEGMLVSVKGEGDTNMEVGDLMKLAYDRATSWREAPTGRV